MLAVGHVVCVYMCVRVSAHMHLVAATLACPSRVHTPQVLGGLWYGAGNLAAPVLVAVAANAVDYFNYHQIVLKRDAKADRSSSGSK